MKENLTIGGIVLAVALGMFVALDGGQPSNITYQAPVYNAPQASSYQVPSVSEEKVGAVASPDIPSPYLRFGTGYGVREWNYGSGLGTATTTICSFKSPSSTSTLEFAAVKVDTSSTTASTLYVAKGADTNATTTNFVTRAIAANAQDMVIASSTDFTTSENNIFAPNQYLNVGMSGGTGTFSPAGGCYATFRDYESH